MSHINRLHTRANVMLLSSILCLLSLPAMAKQGDLKQELKIVAVSQFADIKNNQIIFNGPVKIVQGSININADELRAFTPENSTSKKLIATGKPATFSQELDDGQIGTASADEISYDLATTTLTLTGNAKLNQSGSQVTGNRIKYNINAQELIAESSGTGQDRVITIIQPENFQDESAPKQKLPEIPVKKQIKP
ncbi:MAG: lipopolysaccharide transport periplasmic protein LptA [Shewanella psychromarinicola]|jgi:lipopolysaccharide export system protein LptA|uniref:Lipopolysaccharide export system protein LptA n=1 Tax=Shewanella psychromarinicola TaxID=2487742 RepID=A0A3N4E8S9_9GAMM|nr:lipopolysaccharide transport periplasmic protein LptA [Shewanella psychromarinicola]AZG34861.1 lipopolysaccharide transport periplasmic protein LptA [Shewanella psychromarinicola]MCL1083965.1 lipopolysaccharide transport periplasmic protein LptA [Shewanella psychromarinicola]RPA33347.1 lipopolysaccharide transport periplasmic protein LptA [Shewanella psychromarinicola]|tara:strand:+ start:12528 stop:13109 length:582 start_codon:yes stop_codon:yes gene_type:complete